MTSVSGDREVPAAATASSVDGGTERCPRCGSHNTKFCYYNNYNLTQPRHFCKACRRYWTLGGSIRDVPIGGSTRSSGHRSKQQTSGRPGSVFAAPSSSSGRRLLPSQGPATTYTSPSSSSSSSPLVNSGAPSIIPISEVPKPESTTTNESGAMDEVGVFTSLLTEPPPAGFMALRDPFLPGFDDFSLELGLAGGPTGTANQLSFGMGTGVVAWPSFGDDGGAGLMPGANGGSVTGGVRREGEASRAVPGGAELVCGDGGDCFGWPEPAISATPGERSALQ